MPSLGDRRLWIILITVVVGLLAMHGPSFVSSTTSSSTAHAMTVDGPEHPAQHPAEAHSAVAHSAAVSPAVSTGDQAPSGHDHDAAAHLLYLCVAILLALAVIGLAQLAGRRLRLLELLPAPRAPSVARWRDRHPPPYGIALLDRLCVSLT